MKCCVPSCSNASNNAFVSKEITFYSFPHELHLCAAWLRVLGVEDCQLPDPAYVCSLHFLNDDFQETTTGLKLHCDAVPSIVHTCMVCLDTDSKLYSLRRYNMEEAYENLTGILLRDIETLPQTLCLECTQRLRNCSKFREKCLRTKSLLIDLVNKQKIITLESIKTIDRKENKLTSNIVETLFDSDYCDLYILECSEEDAQVELNRIVDKIASSANKESVDVKQIIDTSTSVPKLKNIINEVNSSIHDPPTTIQENGENKDGNTYIDTEAELEDSVDKVIANIHKFTATKETNKGTYYCSLADAQTQLGHFVDEVTAGLQETIDVNEVIDNVRASFVDNLMQENNSIEAKTISKERINNTKSEVCSIVSKKTKHNDYEKCIHLDSDKIKTSLPEISVQTHNLKSSKFVLDNLQGKEFTAMTQKSTKILYTIANNDKKSPKSNESEKESSKIAAVAESDPVKVAKTNNKSKKDLYTEDSKNSLTDQKPHEIPVSELENKFRSGIITSDPEIGNNSDCAIDDPFTKMSNIVGRNIETGMKVIPLSNEVGTSFNRVPANVENDTAQKENRKSLIIVNNKPSQSSYFRNIDSGINTKKTIYSKKEKIKSNNSTPNNQQKKRSIMEGSIREKVNEMQISDNAEKFRETLNSETQTQSTQLVNKKTDAISNKNVNIEQNNKYCETPTESKEDALDIKIDCDNLSSRIEIFSKKECTKVGFDDIKERHNLAADNASKHFDRPGSANNMVWFPVKHTIALCKGKKVKKNRIIALKGLVHTNINNNHPIEFMHKILPSAKKLCIDDSNELIIHNKDIVNKQVVINNRDAGEMKIGELDGEVEECFADKCNEKFRTLLHNDNTNSNNSEVDIYKSAIKSVKTSVEINHNITKNTNGSASIIKSNKFVEKSTVEKKNAYSSRVNKEKISKFNNSIKPVNISKNDKDILERKTPFDNVKSGNKIFKSNTFKNVKVTKKGKKFLNVNNNISKSRLENLSHRCSSSNKDKATLFYLSEVENNNIDNLVEKKDVGCEVPKLIDKCSKMNLSQIKEIKPDFVNKTIDFDKANKGTQKEIPSDITLERCRPVKGYQSNIDNDKIPKVINSKSRLDLFKDILQTTATKENEISRFIESESSEASEPIDVNSNEECKDNILNYISNTLENKKPIVSTESNTADIPSAVKLLSPKSNRDTVKTINFNDFNAWKLRKSTLNKSPTNRIRDKKDKNVHRLTLSCDICDYKTDRKKYMESHVLLHIGKQDLKKVYPCTHCKYKTKNRHHLQYHLRTHTGEKPFNCSFCEQRFARKTNLVNHMRTHTGEKPFSCKYCNYRCTDSSNLKTHVRTHTREKPFSCKFCNYTCIQSSTLVSHLRRHTGERPYTCDVCQKKFSGKGNLIKHQKTHLDIRPYVCKICHNKFSQKSNLIRHLKTHSAYDNV